MSERDEILRVDGLVKRFNLPDGRFVGAVNDVSFRLKRGETLGLVGESGSGKSTIGRCLIGLEDATDGAIHLAPNADRRPHGRLQMVFQDPSASLNPRRTVRQTVSEPLRLAGGQDRKSISRAVEEMLETMGLPRDVADLHPISLSPSEQQRVGIARALITYPDVVILDEPTSMLDPTARATVISVLRAFQEKNGTSYLFISHDMQAVEDLSQRVAVLYLGRLVEMGPIGEVMSQQWHPYSRALLDSVLVPDPSKPLPPTPIRGEIPSAINPPDQCPFVGRCTNKIEGCEGPFPTASRHVGRLVCCHAPLGGHA